MFELPRRGLLLAGASTLCGCLGAATIELRGAGATLPAHQYAHWLAAYVERARHVSIAYLPIGSGGGMRQLAQGAVDFGATDVDLDDTERVLFGREILLVPTAIGAVGICYNLPVAGQLRLSRALCAAIYLGEVERWDAPAIRLENPTISLPSLPIAPVFRADGGGSTALFSLGLARESPKLRERIGTGRGVRFERGIGAHGSDGVVDVVSSTTGAIGYVEVVHALRRGLPIAAIDDGSGGFVGPTRDAVLRAYRGEGGVEGGYPLASPTYLMLPLAWNDAAKGAAMARFAYWILTEGQSHLARGADEAFASSLLPLPETMATSARKELRRLTSGTTNLLAID